jgi:hypothetical protein
MFIADLPTSGLQQLDAIPQIRKLGEPDRRFTHLVDALVHLDELGIDARQIADVGLVQTVQDHNPKRHHRQ